MNQTTSGTKVRHTAPERIYRVRARVPCISQQKVIAETLKNYDELIATNHRRVELLEQSARHLFKKWFVRLRYPGHEHIEVAGGVPEGWSKEPLSSVAEISFGFPFASNLFNKEESGRPLARIRDIPAGRSSTFTTEDAGSQYLVQDGDVLIGMDGDFHINFWSGGIAWLNQRVTRLRSNGGVPLGLIRYAIEQPIRYFNDTITGSTVSHLGAKHLRQVHLLLPPQALLAVASEAFEDIRRQVVTLRRQSIVAEKARDLLLPRLMDGRISV